MKRIILISFFVLFLIISCGHKKKPTGGKKDTENPTILAITPDEFSDISDQDIEVVFSKPIDRTSIFSGTYIYPPILKKKFKWDKNILKIKILEDLEKNTNYFFTFSRKIKGEHKNELDKKTVFIFSSGKLNENRISGNIDFEEKEDSSELVKFKLMTPDSTEIFSKEIKGNAFTFDNLNDVEHILEAFIDKNNNNKYDYEKEPYFHTIIPNQQILSVNVELIYADTLKPEIKSAKVLWDNQLKLKFSEEVKLFSEIQISSSDSMEIPLEVVAFSLKDAEISIITGKMDTLKYKVILKGLEDRKSNIADESYILFDGITVCDTIAPSIVSTIPRNGSTISTLYPEITILFSEIILKDNFHVSLVEVETGRKIESEILKSDSDEYRIKFKESLVNYSSYRCLINASDAENNELEREYELNFIPIIR